MFILIRNMNSSDISCRAIKIDNQVIDNNRRDDWAVRVESQIKLDIQIQAGSNEIKHFLINASEEVVDNIFFMSC